MVTLRPIRPTDPPLDVMQRDGDRLSRLASDALVPVLARGVPAVLLDPLAEGIGTALGEITLAAYLAGIDAAQGVRS